MRIFKLTQLSLLFLCSTQLFAQYQAPVAGPRPPVGDAYKTLRLSILLDLIEFELHQTVAALNVTIDSHKALTGIDADLKFTYKAGKPYMTATNHKDQPNYYYMRMPLIISYEVKDVKWKGIPFPTRKIHQFVDLVTTCENWFTTQGSLHFNLEMQKSYADDRPSTVLPLNFYIGNTLPALIDSKMQANLPRIFHQSNTPAAACSCLDVKAGTDQENYYKDSEIKYHVYEVPTADVNNLEISILNIRRLYVHRHPDYQVLYQETEDIELEFYANQMKKAVQVNKIKEEQTFQLNAGKILLPKPSEEDLLVLLANIKVKNQPESKKITETLMFNKMDQFGVGYHKIIFFKSFLMPLTPLPNGKKAKAPEVRLPAYEVTLRIQAITTEAMARNEK